MVAQLVIMVAQLVIMVAIILTVVILATIQAAEIVVSLIIAKIPEFIALVEGKFVALIMLVPVTVVIAVLPVWDKNTARKVNYVKGQP